MPRFAVAGLYHESNTFVDQPTDERDFRVLAGDALRDAFAGTQTVCGGFLAACPDAVPALHALATPSGVVARRWRTRCWRR